MTEFIYTWPDGRQEVRYRRVTGSPEELELLAELASLKSLFGEGCPYSARPTSDKP